MVGATILTYASLNFLVSIFFDSILLYSLRREKPNIRYASLTESQPDSCEVVCEVM